MSKILYSRIIVPLMLLLISVIEASALTVAVFPLDDLSSESNSINLSLTETLRQELSRQGLAVVPLKQVEGFMSAHRIRRLGVLQAQEVVAVRDELKADLVLLGTLCQQSDKAQVLGETITLLRTSDGKVIWSSSKGVSLLVEQRLLGIKEPKTMEELHEILVRDLFAGWPADLQNLVGQPDSNRNEVTIKSDPSTEVDSVLFTPKHVRPGEDVKCTIRFKGRRGDGDVKVFIRVGNRIHTAKTDDGVYYQVSWVGSDDKIGKPMKVAMNVPESHIVNGIWSGESQDANYPVSLILEWPSGKREEFFVGSYVVDSFPPEMMLKFKAKSLDGLPAFRKELPISIFFKRNEPIEQWRLAVLSPEGEILLEDKGSGQPPDSFLWQGQDRKNQRLDPGLYGIDFRVWDRAGNIGQVSERVQLLSVKPGLDLAVVREAGQIQATLSAQDQVQISSWRMELWSRDNIMVKTFEGQALPVKINLSEKLVAESGQIDCIVQVRDTMGMKATKKVPDLLAQLKSASEGNGASVDLDGSDDWHEDF